MLELINVIHHQLSAEKDELRPFGVKQVILIGEFLYPSCTRDYNNYAIIITRFLYGATVNSTITLQL